MGVAVARLGGLLVVRNHPTSADVNQALGKVQIQPSEVYVAATSHTSTPWAIIVVSIVLGLAGLVLLALTAIRRRGGNPEATPAELAST
jgi:MYXO-CTERM domain-containing protein